MSESNPDNRSPSRAPKISKTTPRIFREPIPLFALLLGAYGVVGRNGYDSAEIGSQRRAAQFAQENPRPEMPNELKEKFADLQKTALTELSREVIGQGKTVSKDVWEEIVIAYHYNFSNLKPGAAVREEQIRAEIALNQTADMDVAKKNDLNEKDIEKMAIDYNTKLTGLIVEKSGKEQEINAKLTAWNTELEKTQQLSGTDTANLVLSTMMLLLAEGYFTAALGYTVGTWIAARPQNPKPEISRG